MATATVPDILDRIHAINQTITGVKARRYFDNTDSAKLPLLVAYPRRVIARERLYEWQVRITREFVIVAILGSFMQGIPTESAQKLAESLVESIEDAYGTRDRLQLNGDTLVNLYRADLGADTGIIEREGDLAVIEFPLNVIYDRDTPQV